MGQLAFDLPDPNASEGRGSQGVRLVHYLGGKSRLIAAIQAVVNDVAEPGATACDLFSGSGVVSSALAESRPVVAVDIQEYARVLGAALLHPEPVSSSAFHPLVREIEADPLREQLLQCFQPLLDLETDAVEKARRGSPDLLADLIETGSLISLQIDGPSVLRESVKPCYQDTLKRLTKADVDESVLSMTSRYFGGLFFGFRQAIELDTLLERLTKLPTELQDLGKAAILSTASEITSSVGNQFAQPVRPRDRSGKPKAGLWKRITESVNVDTAQVCQQSLQKLLQNIPTRHAGIAIRSDYREFLKAWSESIGVFYIDPPYTRDHYSRFYHVLETLCRRDNPDVTRSNLGGGARISRGAYRADRHQSPFCIRSQAPEAFDNLLRQCRQFEAPVVLSYSPPHDSGRSRPRVMRSDVIEKVARRHFENVEVETVEDVAHSKLTKSELHLETPDLAEVLIICRP